MALPERLPRPTPADFCDIPADATVLGTADGMLYIQLGATIWRRAVAEWRVFCDAPSWPYTATYRALRPVRGPLETS